MGNNVALPYSHPIHGGVHEGTDVTIHGRAPMPGKRFSVNLTSGPEFPESPEVPFHFDVRFDEHKVVRNHKKGPHWGREETDGGLPIHKAKDFTFHLKAGPRGYKISFDGKHFCDFEHRIPKEHAKFLYIKGDVIITSIEFKNPHGPGHHGPGHHPHRHPGPHHRPHHPGQHGPPFVYPSFQPGPPGMTPPFFPGPPHVHPPPPAYPQPQPPAQYPGEQPIYNPSVPINTLIRGGLHPGKLIFISGTPKPGAHRFTVNLGIGADKGRDLALHFDVRFNFNNERNVVVRTSRQGGKFESEERQISSFPFVPGSSFEMMILTEPNCFKVAVNNQHFLEFNHRIKPLKRIDHVHVKGDVTLSQIRLQ